MGRSLPSGRVTFAFTDVVGSTRTFIEHGDVYTEALTRLHTLIEEQCHHAGGVVVETEGDGAFLAFPDSVGALTALITIQDRLENDRLESDPPEGDRPEGLRLRIRAGAHVGEAHPIGDRYLALPVYVASRVAATANAGQVIVSGDLHDELARAGWSVQPPAQQLGEFQLKDIADPVQLWRLVGDATPPRALPALRTNVRTARTTFVGREHELHDVAGLLAQPGLVTLVGPGGVGKTRLASELAASVATSYHGGAWLAELASIERPDQVPGVVGALLGLTSSDESALAAELNRRGRTLLVLDNCEHVIDRAAELALRLVLACPELSVLATSREALSVPEETVWALRPLSVDGPAVELFTDRAGPRAGDLDRARITEICTALDGLPLAIELAASHTYALGIDELLDSVLSLSEGEGRRGVQLRHRSLDGVLEWSLAMLSPAQRDALLVLTMFPGRFTAEMAHALLAATPRAETSALPRLARLSLVDLDGAEYRLLQTILTSARRRLAQDPELEAQAVEALLTWAEEYAARLYEEDTFHEEVSLDTQLACEAALAHANGASRLSKVWDLLRVLGNNRSHSPALLELAAQVPRSAPTDGNSLRTLYAALVIPAVGFEVAIDTELLSAMERVAEMDPDPRLKLKILNLRARLRYAQGQPEAALATQLKAIEYAEAIPVLRNHLPGEVTAAGIYCAVKGDLESASDYYRRSAALSRELGLTTSVLYATLNLAEIALLSHQPKAARDRSLATLDDAPPDWKLRGLAFCYLARAHHELGDQDAALAAAEEALGAFEFGDPPDDLAVEILLTILGEDARIGRLRGRLDSPA